LHEGSEYGDGQQQCDHRRIGEHEAEHASLKRMHESQPSFLCVMVLWTGLVVARGGMCR
jgi:hypothetical protein